MKGLWQYRGPRRSVRSETPSPAPAQEAAAWSTRGFGSLRRDSPTAHQAPAGLSPLTPHNRGGETGPILWMRLLRLVRGLHSTRALDPLVGKTRSLATSCGTQGTCPPSATWGLCSLAALRDPGGRGELCGLTAARRLTHPRLAPWMEGPFGYGQATTRATGAGTLREPWGTGCQAAAFGS